VEISDLLVLANKDFALTEQRLAADVEPLQENHDRGVLRVGVCLMTGKTGAQYGCRTI
jgi:hypothetical protein